MSPRPAPIRHGRLAAQAAIALVAFGLAAAPPAAGRLLLVPLDGRPAARTFALALDHHMLPLAPGPLHGSLIVRVTRGGAIATMLGAGVLPLPALSGGCVA